MNFNVLAGVTAVSMPSDRAKTPSTLTAAHEPGNTAPPKGRNACSNAVDDVSRANTAGVRRNDSTGVWGRCGANSATTSAAGGALSSCEDANRHAPKSTTVGNAATNNKNATGFVACLRPVSRRPFTTWLVESGTPPLDRDVRGP